MRAQMTSFAGYAATLDGLHQQVVDQRFNDDETWKFRGYVVPILIASN